jgi:predicted  nucleic acid-binding Zn-ribbon protein
MSLALPLYRLQQIDKSLKQVSLRLASIQVTLENNAELQSATKVFEIAKSRHHKIEVDLKNAEFAASNLRIKLELAESNLYSGHIHNPKELQDLQKDITVTKRNLGLLEDQQLELMMAAESSLAELNTARQDFEQVQGKVISENATLKAELVNLQKELENLNTQRQAVLPVIDASSLRLYESLRQKHSGMAVSMVIENACNTCGASLTPGLAQSVRNSNLLILCPMCGRILYSN